MPEQLQLLHLDAGKYFTPTAPIDEKALFAGRRGQLQSVIDVVNQKGQHAVLYGERGVGKTSLSFVMSKYLGAEPVLCPRANCDGMDTFETVWRKIFGEIDMVAERRVAGFSDAVRTDRHSALELFGSDEGPNGVRKVLGRLAENALPIIIIDEFDVLPPETKGIFADLIKALSDHAVPATVVLVGVADGVSDLISEHQSVERALVQIRVPRMSQSEISEILDNGLRSLELQMEPPAKNRIVKLAQGLPHYAHLLGLHSVRAAGQRRSSVINLHDVDKAIGAGLQSAQHSIQSAFHKATISPRPDNLFKQVLCACAVADTDEFGYFAAADVRSPIRRITGREYDISAFARHLNEFCSEKRGSILHRIGTPRRYRFRFTNPLLQPFAIMNGLSSGMLAPDML